MNLKSISTHVRHWLEIVHPSAFLLAAQLILLLLYAAFEENPAGRAVISSFGVAVLMLVFWAVIRTPAANNIARVLAVPAFSLTALSAIFPSNPTLPGWSSFFEGIFYFYAAGSMIAYMLEDTTVTVDELFAAGTTFTLFAWGYAHMFMVVQTWSPGSFVGVTPGQPVTFLELLFLSFTNLSATGLGDIYPASKIARVLLMLEQFTGVGYVAVVVSRLIGMTMVRQRSRRA
ncbi:MAG: ion channel [Bellilinea sp.]